MTAKILDGKALAADIKKNIAEQVKEREAQGRSKPGLAVILVGSDPASEIYVGHKRRACDAVGIYSEYHHLPADTQKETLFSLIEQCNQNDNVHGILLQLPLPPQIPADECLELIDPKKDVDGFHPYNFGRLGLRRPALRPCTPYGIMKLLETTGEDLTGKEAVIVGASNIVGRPMALELLMVGCTVTLCHRFTKDLEKHINEADLLISATGKRGIIQSSWIKNGAIVVDVGINRLENGSIVGDLDFDTARERASWITPVPGGVGPMTVAMLLSNTLQAATN